MKFLLRLSRISLILVCTFCPDPTVQKLGIITVMSAANLLLMFLCVYMNRFMCKECVLERGQSSHWYTG